MALQPTRKEVVRAKPAPTISSDFGTAPLRATQTAAQTLGAIARKGGEINEAYAMKNKRADMMADDLNFSAKKREVLMTAADNAARTADPEEVNRIYKKAEKEISDWVGGKHGGIPNIRWKDQVPVIQGEAQNFTVALDGERRQRRLSLSRANTRASAEKNMDVGVINNSPMMMDRAARIMVTGEMMTQQQADAWLAEKTRDAQTLESKNMANLIATKSPEEAALLADAEKKEAEKYGALTDDEISIVKASYDDAVVTSAKREKNREAAQELITNERNYTASTGMLESLYKQEMDNPQIAEAARVFGEENQYRDAQTIAWSNSPEQQKKLLEAQDYADIRRDIHRYDKADDPDGSALRAMMYDIAKYGDDGDSMMQELYMVTTGQKLGGIDANGMKAVNQQIEGIVDEAVSTYGSAQGGSFISTLGQLTIGGRVAAKMMPDKKPKNLPSSFVEDIPIGPTKTPVEVSRMELQIKNYMANLIKDQKMTLDEALDALDEHPMFIDLKNAKLIRFEANWESFDRTGTWIDEQPMETGL